jgi:hypothetical protein
MVDHGRKREGKETTFSTICWPITEDEYRQITQPSDSGLQPNLAARPQELVALPPPCSTITENLRVLRKFHESMLTAVHIGLGAKPALCHISKKSGTGVHHINS